MAPPGWGQPQAPYWAAPGGPVPAVAPRKRRWPMVLGILVVLLLLTVGGCAVLIRKGWNALSAPVDASNVFLTAVAEDDAANLERLLCGRAVEGLSDVRRIRAAGFTGGKQLRSSSIVNNAATVSGTIDTRTGAQAIALQLSHVGGGDGEDGWCVTDVQLG